MYGHCLNGTRDISFILTTASQSKNCALPNPIRKVSCGFSCNDGEYYIISQKKCTVCPPGKHSLSIKTYNSFKTLPSEFIREHDDEQESKDWTTDGTYITSGKQDAFATALLTLPLDIILPNGSVTFVYEHFGAEGNTDSESSSFLWFDIDGKAAHNHSLVSQSWKSETFPLTFGHHNLTWRYQTSQKHRETFDGARIKEIRIFGTEPLVRTCAPCKPGETSTFGICTKCPRGSFSNQSGSSKCTKCGNNEYTPTMGATKCLVKRPCALSDYDIKYTECISSSSSDESTPQTPFRTQYYTLREPVVCNPSHANSIRQPANVTVPCARCSPGMYRKEQSVKGSHSTNTLSLCEPCPKGQYRSDDQDDNACHDCAAGTAASESVILQGGEDLARYFQTSCVDHVFSSSSTSRKNAHTIRTPLLNDETTANENGCASDGWEGRENSIDSGHFHRSPVQLRLTLPINPEEHNAQIRFSFELHMQKGSMFKVFSSSMSAPVVLASGDDTNMRSNKGTYYKATGNGEEYAFSLGLKPGDKHFTWLFEKGPISSTEKDIEDDYVKINRIELIGMKSSQTSFNNLNFKLSKNSNGFLHNTHQLNEQTEILSSTPTFPVGGASHCSVCPAGTSSSAAAAKCSTCAIGTSSFSLPVFKNTLNSELKKQDNNTKISLYQSNFYSLSPFYRSLLHNTVNISSIVFSAYAAATVGQTECTTCDSSSFQSQESKSGCMPCGKHMHASASRDTCVSDRLSSEDEVLLLSKSPKEEPTSLLQKGCSFVHNDTVSFNFSGLVNEEDEMAGPFLVPSSESLHFSMCNRRASHKYCKGRNYRGESVELEGLFGCYIDSENVPHSIGNKIGFQYVDKEHPYEEWNPYHALLQPIQEALGNTTENEPNPDESDSNPEERSAALSQRQLSRLQRRLNARMFNNKENDPNTEMPEGVYVTFYDGEMCSPLISTINTSSPLSSLIYNYGVPRSTVVYLQCVPDGGIGTPEILTSSSFSSLLNTRNDLNSDGLSSKGASISNSGPGVYGSDCVHRVLWRSQFGCRLCL